MKHGPLRYYWSRIGALTFLFGVGCLGGFMLHWTTIDKFKDLLPLLYVLGPLFMLFGFIGGISHYRNGYAYYRKSKVYPKDLEAWTEYDNSLLIVFGNLAKLLTYGKQKAIKRGYVKMTTQYNHRKVVKGWFFTEG